MRSLLDFLIAIWPYAVTVVALLGLAILIYIFLIFRSARRKEIEKQAAASPQPQGKAAPAGTMKASFSQTIERLKHHVSGRISRYQIPWVALAGEAGSGKTSLLDDARLQLPLGRPSEVESGIHEDLNWFLFDDGIVLDVAGRFVLGSQGAPDDERGWDRFLRLLRRHRSDRPIDGFVISIPAGDLAGPARKTPEELARKGERISQKLWRAQKVLGMRFPVYALVTRCDGIGGFDSFCQGLPQRLADNIFGWSSPYTLPSAYRSEWVDEAFDSLRGDLYRAQFELFCQPREIQQRDEFFLFPSRLERLREPLRAYLNQLFRTSVYYESFLFRGIYFCGRNRSQTQPGMPPAGRKQAVAVEPGVEPAASPPRTTRRSPGERIFFVRDLFEKKVFAEKLLARPVTRSLISRNRTVRALQVACLLLALVGIFGLTFADGQLHDYEDGILSALQSVHSTLRMHDTLRGPVGNPQSAEHLTRKEQTTALLRGMQQIQTDTLTSAFIPTSWVSPLNQSIERVFQLAYEKIIFDAMWLGLEQKARDLSNREVYEGTYAENRLPPQALLSSRDGNQRPVEAVLPDLVPLDKTEEYRQINLFLDDLITLEQNVDRYNSLQQPGAGSLTSLGELVRYLFDFELDRGFYENDGFYRAALERGGARFFRKDDYRTAMEQKFKEFEASLWTGFLANFTPQAALQVLRERINNLVDGRAPAQSQPMVASQEEIEAYRAVEQAVRTTGLLVRSPQYGWLTQSDFTSFEPLQEKIAQTTFLSDSLITEIRDEGLLRLQSMRLQLSGEQTELTGPLLDAIHAGTPLQLSQPVTDLGQAVNDFLDQSFVTASPRLRFQSELRADQRLLWDPRALQSAIQFAAPYRDFVSKGLPRFPSLLREPLRIVSLNRLNDVMEDRIAEAQQFQSGTRRGQTGNEQLLVLEARSFRRAVPYLTQLLNLFDELLLEDSYAALYQLLEVQTARFLEGVNQLREERHLYSVKTPQAPSWRGPSSLAILLFDARSSQDLSNYLAAQRDEMQRLLDTFARPHLDLLDQHGESGRREQGDLIKQWRGIRSDLDEYALKKPGNALLQLESFVLDEMPKINLENYAQRIRSAELHRASNDYFLEQRNLIRDAVFEACDRMALRQAEERYARLAAYFNQELRGRFPFASPQAEADADPRAVQALFEIFDRFSPSDREVLSRHLSQDAQAQAALAFVERMDAVRQFFSTFLPGGLSTFPVYSLEAEFRVNRQFEQGGHQIIDWELSAGDRTIGYSEAGKKLVWNFGDPVRLTMRWADDSPFSPVDGAGQPRGFSLSGLSVSYSYRSPWSLLRLLANHRSGARDLGRLTDPDPHTLRVQVDTVAQWWSVPERDGEARPVRAYFRVRLSTPDGKESQVMPEFPEQAPEGN